MLFDSYLICVIYFVFPLVHLSYSRTTIAFEGNRTLRGSGWRWTLGCLFQDELEEQLPGQPFHQRAGFNFNITIYTIDGIQESSGCRYILDEFGYRWKKFTSTTRIFTACPGPGKPNAYFGYDDVRRNKSYEIGMFMSVIETNDLDKIECKFTLPGSYSELGYELQLSDTHRFFANLSSMGNISLQQLQDDAKPYVDSITAYKCSFWDNPYRRSDTPRFLEDGLQFSITILSRSNVRQQHNCTYSKLAGSWVRSQSSETYVDASVDCSKIVSAYIPPTQTKDFTIVLPLNLTVSNNNRRMTCVFSGAGYVNFQSSVEFQRAEEFGLQLTTRTNSKYPVEGRPVVFSCKAQNGESLPVTYFVESVDRPFPRTLARDVIQDQTFTPTIDHRLGLTVTCKYKGSLQTEIVATLSFNSTVYFVSPGSYNPTVRIARNSRGQKLYCSMKSDSFPSNVEYYWIGLRGERVVGNEYSLDTRGDYGTTSEVTCGLRTRGKEDYLNYPTNRFTIIWTASDGAPYDTTVVSRITHRNTIQPTTTKRPFTTARGFTVFQLTTEAAKKKKKSDNTYLWYLALAAICLVGFLMFVIYVRVKRKQKRLRVFSTKKRRKAKHRQRASRIWTASRQY